MRIVYSCVIDRTPKLYWEGLLFRRAITEIAGVAPQDVVMHVTPSVEAAARSALSGPCQCVEIAPFGADHRHANKIGQLAALDGIKGEAFALLDADMVVLRPLSAEDVAPRTVAGVPVFGASPDERCLRRLYRAFCDKPGDWVSLVGLDGAPFVTHRNNLNGGLYLVPRALTRPFGEVWRRRAERLTASAEARCGAPYTFCDQIAAGLALAELGLRATHVGAAMNCPPRTARREAASVIHDCAKYEVADRDEGGHLRADPEVAQRPERRALGALIDAVNASAEGRAFAIYRRFRYALTAHEFAAAGALIDAMARAPYRFPSVENDMHEHLAVYRAMVAREAASR